MKPAQHTAHQQLVNSVACHPEKGCRLLEVYNPLFLNHRPAHGLKIVSREGKALLRRPPSNVRLQGFCRSFGVHGSLRRSTVILILRRSCASRELHDLRWPLVPGRQFGGTGFNDTTKMSAWLGDHSCKLFKRRWWIVLEWIELRFFRNLDLDISNAAIGSAITV